MLLFGRVAAGRIVADENAWKRFVAREITPRFPDGLTVIDAAGQWRDPVHSAVVREPTKAVLIVHEDAPAAHARLNEVADAYKRRFAQRSVGIVTSPACASF